MSEMSFKLTIKWVRTEWLPKFEVAVTSLETWFRLFFVDFSQLCYHSLGVRLHCLEESLSLNLTLTLKTLEGESKIEAKGVSLTPNEWKWRMLFKWKLKEEPESSCYYKFGQLAFFICALSPSLYTKSTINAFTAKNVHHRLNFKANNSTKLSNDSYS